MLYLASKSPRRKQLLQQLGIEFEIVEIDIEESWNGEESPADYVSRLAIEKARAGKIKLGTNSPVLASDTEVVSENKILGKPEDRKVAINMLMKLSGKTHQVYSAVALVNHKEQLEINISSVTFKTLSINECEHYCDTEKPYDKAGAYGIQGKAAAFISKLEGSYSAL